MCASNRVSAIEQVKPIIEDLLLLQHGVVMFDAPWNQDVLVIAPILACLCDNLRASEIVGHLRGNPNSCPQCLVSRITCISALHVQIIIPIMQCDKKVHPDVICNIRTKDTMLPIFQQISQAPPTARSRLKTRYGLDEPTPLLELSFDVYRYM